MTRKGGYLGGPTIFFPKQAPRLVSGFNDRFQGPLIPAHWYPHSTKMPKLPWASKAGTPGPTRRCLSCFGKNTLLKQQMRKPGGLPGCWAPSWTESRPKEGRRCGRNQSNQCHRRGPEHTSHPPRAKAEAQLGGRRVTCPRPWVGGPLCTQPSAGLRPHQIVSRQVGGKQGKQGCGSGKSAQDGAEARAEVGPAPGLCPAPESEPVCALRS